MTQCLDYLVKTNCLLTLVYFLIPVTYIDNNNILQSKVYFNHFPLKHNNMNVYVLAESHKLWHDADSKNQLW